MTEYQKIADGLLSMTHPEIHLLKAQAAQGEAEQGDARGPMRRPGPAVAALRAVKFAFAALVAGSRAIPLGDNGGITRKLGEYGSHLKGC